MTDILSGLRKSDAVRTFGGSFRGGYNRALVDVREALRNPTDEQRAAAGKALWDAARQPGDPAWENLDLGLRRIYEKEACAVLAAAGEEK